MSEHGPIAIGIDVGGSGIKGAAVDLTTGALASNRHRILTPQPATPQACLHVIARIVKAIVREMPDAATVPIGVGMPSVVIDGVTKSAANIDPAWIGFDAEEGLQRILGRPVRMVNDADAAGLAEMRFGAGLGKSGTVIVLTLGTGLGSGFFVDGRLVPNTELGHMEIRGRDAERRSAAAARVRRGISWKAWAEDLDEHLNAIHRLFWPSLLILGGGVSKNADKFIPRLTVPTTIVAATLRNEAGIVGAALFAAEHADGEPIAIPAAGLDARPEAEAAEAAEAEAAEEAAAAAAEEAEAAEEAAVEAEVEAEEAEEAATEAEAAAAAEAEAEAAAAAVAEEAAGVLESEATAGQEAATHVERGTLAPEMTEPAEARAAEASPRAAEDVPIEPSVTVAPAWAADAPEGDTQGYPIAPATMASAAPDQAVEATTAGEAEAAIDGDEGRPREGAEGDAPDRDAGGDDDVTTEPLGSSGPVDVATTDDAAVGSEVPRDAGGSAPAEQA